MSTALTPDVHINELALPAPSPARIEMVQLASESRDESNARLGTFRDMETGQQYKTLDMRMLAMVTSRVLWPEKIGLPQSKQFACRSNDGEVPDPTVAEPKHSDCVTCQYAQWANGRRPLCSEKVVVLFIHEKTGKLHVMTLSGSSIGRKTPRPTGMIAVKVSISNDLLSRARKLTRTPKLHDYIVVVKAVKGEGQFKYYKLEPTALKYRPLDGAADAMYTQALLGNRKLLYGTT